VGTGLCPVRRKSSFFFVELRSTRAGQSPGAPQPAPTVLLFHAFSSTNFCVVTLVWGRAMPRPKMDCSWRMGLCSVPCRARSFLSSSARPGRGKAPPPHRACPYSLASPYFCFNQLLCSDSCVGTGLCPVRRWIVLGGWDRAPCRVGPIFSVELRSTWAGQSPAPHGRHSVKRPSNIPALPLRAPQP
jgi:hypothetical protein